MVTPFGKELILLGGRKKEETGGGKSVQGSGAENNGIR